MVLTMKYNEAYRKYMEERNRKSKKLMRYIGFLIGVVVTVLAVSYFGKQSLLQSTSISITPMCDLYISDNNEDVQISTEDIIAFRENPGVSELMIRLKPGSAPKKEYKARDNVELHQERMDYLRTCKIGGL